MIEATLTNGAGTMQLPVLQVPLSEEPLEIAADVQTLDGNVYTSFVAQKRLWTLPWTVMSEDDYDLVKAFYDYQFTNFEFPTLSFNNYGTITNVPVRMYLNTKQVYNNCGDVENIELRFRETVAL